MGLISNGTTIFDAGAMAVGGSMVHIKTLTASSSATLSFVNGSSGVILDARYTLNIYFFLRIYTSEEMMVIFQYFFLLILDQVMSGNNINFF